MYVMGLRGLRGLGGLSGLRGLVMSMAILIINNLRLMHRRQVEQEINTRRQKNHEISLLPINNRRWRDKEIHIKQIKT